MNEAEHDTITAQAHAEELDKRRKWADKLLEADPEYLDWVNESYEECQREAGEDT